ncbi:MAG: exonuclease [Candidatus Nitrosothermus koennekii]|nr:MAG: exonuclease [Candidatus Nitrosothermus koennekii]
MALDPSKSIDADLTFISHAHSDHMHMPTKNSKIIASKETVALAKKRGYDIECYEEFDGVKLIDSGHVLGSKSLLIDGILYTSDICIRDRAFLKGAKIPRCDTLIIETTYGKEGFNFPSIDKVCDMANNIISKLYSHGVPVILLGYPLGKAQILTSLFKHWKPIYLYDTVYEINKVYRELGIDLIDALPYSFAEEEGLLKKKPWVMIAPMQSTRSKFIKDMKSRYSAVTIAFTGWAVNNRYSMHDYTLPLSDHCDFNELLQVVKDAEPKKIYTIHGYVKEFASYLNRLGYNAEPLIKGNMKLTDFTT